MATGWMKQEDKWYYFDSYGASKTGVIEDDGKYYDLSSDGEITEVKIKSEVESGNNTGTTVEINIDTPEYGNYNSLIY